MKTLSERINLILQAKGWSAAELARQAGVSRAAVTDWRNGNVAALTTDVAARISKATGYSMLWVANGEGPRETTPSLVDAGYWPFRSVEWASFQKLTPDEQHDLDRTVARFIAGCLAGR